MAVAYQSSRLAYDINQYGYYKICSCDSDCDHNDPSYYPNEQKIALYIGNRLFF